MSLLGNVVKGVLKSADTKIGEIVEGAEQRSYGAQIPDAEVTPAPGGGIVIKAAENDDLMALNKALEAGGFQGGLNMGRIGELFNPEKSIIGPLEFNIETVLQNIKQNNVELFQHLRRDKQSMESLMALANATGFDNIVYKMLGRKPGDVMPAEDTLAGLVAVIKLGKEMEFGARKALNMSAYLPEQKAAKEEAFKRLRIMMTVTSNLAAQVSGNVSEYGRGLAVVRNLNKIEGMDLSTYAASLDDFVSEMDDGLIDYQLHVFLSLKGPTAKTKFAEKGWGAKTYDFAMENYINALLSSPVTHMVNMGGNASFQVLTLAERGLAGVIGNVRTLGGLRGNVGDQRYMGEAAAEAYGLMMAQKDALILMTRTMITGDSADFISKIDLKNQRTLGSTDSLVDVAAGFANGDYTKSAIDLLGISTRLPGRFLATEDEYFKVITMRRVLYREAHRATQIAYTSARRTGKSRDEARAISEAAYQKVMVNTPQEISDMMTKEARKMTFQGQPEGFMGRMAGPIQSVPGMKTVIPFYNTPTNVVTEVFDRTLNFSPIYRTIMNSVKNSGLPGAKGISTAPISGVELDDALSKLAIGNSIALSMFALVNGDYGDDIIFTGGEQGDFATDKITRGAQNIPKYSVGFKQDDGSYKNFTFSRFDPLSGLLAAGVDMAKYAKHDDSFFLGKMFRAYTFGVADYASSLPFLQGLSELIEAVGGSYQTKETRIARFSKWAGGQATNVGLNVVGNLDRSVFGLGSYASHYFADGNYPLLSSNSFYGTMERLNDPYLSNKMLPEGNSAITGEPYTESPPWLQGIYGAIQKAKAANPLYSHELPTKLNFWGDEMKTGEGKFSEGYNPVKIQRGQYSDLDEELIRLSEIGAGSFSFHSKRVDGTLLNGVQHNQFVKFINEADANGNVLGDLGYDSEGTLLNALNTEMNSTEYFILPTDEDRFDALNNILGERRGTARKKMIKSDELLSELIGPK